MSDLTRRTVVGAGATGLALTLVTATPSEQATAAVPRPAASTRLYRRDRFARQRRKVFRVTGPGVRTTMTLTAVTDLSAGGVRGSTRTFEVTLRSTRRGPEQGTYTLARTGFARTALLLVPTDETRRTYRAVVNNR